MQRLISFLISLVIAVGSDVSGAADDKKAAELLKAAREALGGAAKLTKVQGLTATGALQRAMGDRQMTGEITLHLALPDKMLRSDGISPMGDGAMIVTDQGINGTTPLRNSRTLNMPPGAVIRMPPAPEHGSEQELQMLRNSRAELARLTIAFLLTAPGSLPIEFAYAGEAEAPDGKADVLDMKGEGSFAAKLFLDKATHRPLMIAYRGVAPRMVMQTVRGDGPGGAGAAAAAAGRGEVRAPGAAPAESVDISLFLDDYKTVDGVLLPHHITRSVDGQPSEEWTFKTIKVNPQFKPDTFAPAK